MTSKILEVDTDIDSKDSTMIHEGFRENAATSTILPVLPIEVIERVLDFLHGWHPTLCNCALVCRAWLPRARFVLFTDMHIRDRADFNSLVTASNNPQLARLFADANNLFLDWSSSADQVTWMHSLPFVLGGHFSRLPRLVIKGLSSRLTFPSMALATGFPQFAHVVELHLYFCVFRTLRMLQRFLCAFPSLRSIHLFSVQLESQPTSAALLLSLSHGLRISKLLLETVETRHVDRLFYDWLQETPSSKTLTSLSLKVMQDQAQCEAAERLIRACGNVALTSLGLDFANAQVLDGFSERRVLSACSKLRFFSLSFESSFQYRPSIHADLLAQLPPSSCLTALMLHPVLQLTSASASTSEVELGWVIHLSAVLSQAHFRNLCTVKMTIVIDCAGAAFTRAERELEDDMRELLAALSRSGVELQVRCFVEGSVDADTSDDENESAGDTSDDDADLEDVHNTNASDKMFEAEGGSGRPTHTSSASCQGTGPQQCTRGR